MKINCMLTVDEKVDTSYSLAQKTGQIKKPGLLLVFVMAVVIGILAIIAEYSFKGQIGKMNGLFLATYTGFCCFYFLLGRKHYIRYRLKKYVTNTYKHENDFLSTCEVDDVGITATLGRDHILQATIKWDNIEELRKTDSKIEIFSKSPVMLIVFLKRAFKNDEDYDHCYRMIKNSVHTTEHGRS